MNIYNKNFECYGGSYEIETKQFIYMNLKIIFFFIFIFLNNLMNITLYLMLIYILDYIIKKWLIFKDIKKYF